MARHLMAVCVVCLLCADHVPCKAHFDDISKEDLNKNHIHYGNETPNLINEFNNRNGYEKNYKKVNKKDREIFKIKNENENNANTFVKEELQRYNNKIEHYAKNDELKIKFNRVKRHSNDNLNHNNYDHNENHHENNYDHDHNHKLDNHEFNHQHNNKIMYQSTSTTDEFLKKLFQQFGNSDGTTMNVIGFETMLRRLGLYKLIKEKIPKNDVISNNQNNRSDLLSKLSTESTTSSSLSLSSNESCISSLELISRLSPNQHILSSSSLTVDHIRLNKTSSSNSNETSSRDNNNHNDRQYNTINKADILLDSEDLYTICPILLYHLTASTVLERTGCINSSLISNNMYLSPSSEKILEKESRFYVWVYSIASVLGVSFVGLFGVAVIPCMDHHIYQHIIQFLVALAIGTLTGDAMLHLLPHAMTMTYSEGDSHESMTWKGLAAVLGIIFFFATEICLTMFTEWRKKIEKKEIPSSRVRVMRDADSTSLNNLKTGDKLCKHKYSSYPYCYNEIAIDTKDDQHHYHNSEDKLSNTNKKPTVTDNKNNISVYNHHNNSSNNDHGDHNETVQSLLPQNCTIISDSYSVMNKDDSHNPDNNTISTNLDDGSIEGMALKEKPPLMKEETFTIILREHESSHHGHSHKHGHVHSPPRNLKAVAWMVILGDGLHNFTDGMAIGAAFSNNIAGGFSTAIAVFCHELPHELGDFAVLLKAGMSAKQAVYYNCLTGVLCFLGMIIGVSLGDTPEASAWMFACGAGMFMYIALVDMMPELTSSHNERNAFMQCLIQILGMSCGLGIMLLISLYEQDLQNIFGSNTSHGGHSHHHNHHHGHNHVN